MHQKIAYEWRQLYTEYRKQLETRIAFSFGILLALFILWVSPVSAIESDLVVTDMHPWVYEGLPYFIGFVVLVFASGILEGFFFCLWAASKPIGNTEPFPLSVHH